MSSTPQHHRTKSSTPQHQGPPLRTCHGRCCDGQSPALPVLPPAVANEQTPFALRPSPTHQHPSPAIPFSNADLLPSIPFLPSNSNQHLVIIVPPSTADQILVVPPSPSNSHRQQSPAQPLPTVDREPASTSAPHPLSRRVTSPEKKHDESLPRPPPPPPGAGATSVGRDLNPAA